MTAAPNNSAGHPPDLSARLAHGAGESPAAVAAAAFLNYSPASSRNGDDSGLSQPQRRARAGTVPSRFSPSTPIEGSLTRHGSVTNASTPRSGAGGVAGPGRASPPSPMTSALRAGSRLHTDFGDAAARLRSGSLNLPSRFGGGAASMAKTSSAAAKKSSPTTGGLLWSAPDPAASESSKLGLEDSHAVPIRALEYLGIKDLGISDGRASEGPMFPDAVAASRKYYDAGNHQRIRSYSASIRNIDHTSQTTVHMSNQTTLEKSPLRPRAHTANATIDPASFAVRGSAASDATGPIRSSSRENEGSFMGTEDAYHEGAYLPREDGYSSSRLASADETVDGGDVASHNSHVGPTRALWIGNIPPTVSAEQLHAIFSHYGDIESARVLSHKGCGFINYKTVDEAVLARDTLNGCDVFAGNGPSKIGFAKVPSSSGGGVGPVASGSAASTGSVGAVGSLASQGGPSSSTHTISSRNELDALRDRVQSEILDTLGNMTPRILDNLRYLGADAQELSAARDMLRRADARSYTFVRDIPPAPSIVEMGRKHDVSYLRDVRRRIDSGACSRDEVEQIAIELIDEIDVLTSDYLGNTIVQRLFEVSRDDVKQRMLDRIAPHLASCGVHKNGTWAVQKIIDVASTPEQVRAIVDSLAPFAIPLFLDQYGNYVLQGCLKHADSAFVFEALLANCWEIAQGRFGARAVRACLESEHITQAQQRLAAAMFAYLTVPLCMNANGALLLTWLFESCEFAACYDLVAYALLPHLPLLVTHKLASLCVLKLLNQSVSERSASVILQALYDDDSSTLVLEQVLSEPVNGPGFIYKTLSSTCMTPAMRGMAVQKIKHVMMNMPLPPVHPAYRRLADEVRLPRPTLAGAPQEGGYGPDGRSARHPTRHKYSGPHDKQPFRKHPPQTPSFGGIPQQMGSPHQVPGSPVMVYPPGPPGELARMPAAVAAAAPAPATAYMPPQSPVHMTPHQMQMHMQLLQNAAAMRMSPGLYAQYHAPMPAYNVAPSYYAYSPPPPTSVSPAAPYAAANAFTTDRQAELRAQYTGYDDGGDR